MPSSFGIRLDTVQLHDQACQSLDKRVMQIARDPLPLREHGQLFYPQGICREVRVCGMKVLHQSFRVLVYKLLLPIERQPTDRKQHWEKGNGIFPIRIGWHTDQKTKKNQNNAR
jgi:hypothetical protein